MCVCVSVSTVRSNKMLTKIPNSFNQFQNAPLQETKQLKFSLASYQKIQFGRSEYTIYIY